MPRLEQLRQVVDEIVRLNPDVEERRCGFVHLYGVSATCTILAMKRGLNPELCSAAGMLHDIWNYKVEASPMHGQLGAGEARKILLELGNYSTGEIEMICTAISRHSDKQSIHGDMDELLKDADVFQHYLYDPAAYMEAAAQKVFPDSTAMPMRIHRLERVMSELGIN